MPSFSRSSAGDLLKDGVRGVVGVELCSLSVLGSAAGRLGSATGACSSVDEGIVFMAGSCSEGALSVPGDFARAAGRGGIAGMEGFGDFALAGRGGTVGGAEAIAVDTYAALRFRGIFRITRCVEVCVIVSS